MLNKLNKLSYILKSSNLKEEYLELDNLINSLGLRKNAYLNEAKLFIKRESDSITVYLAGELDFGTQKVGSTRAVRLTGTKNLANDRDIWQQHRDIYSEAYQGLGYATDMLIAMLRELSNNNGVSISYAASDAAQSHNLSLEGASGIKITRIIVIDGKEERFVCPIDKDIVMKIVEDELSKSGQISENSYSEESTFERVINKIYDFFGSSPIEKLNQLFNNPKAYQIIDFPGFNVCSGLMLEWDGAIPSIPVIDSREPEFAREELYNKYLLDMEQAQSDQEKSNITSQYSETLKDIDGQISNREKYVSEVKTKKNPGIISKIKSLF